MWPLRTPYISIQDYKCSTSLPLNFCCTISHILLLLSPFWKVLLILLIHCFVQIKCCCAFLWKAVFSRVVVSWCRRILVTWMSCLLCALCTQSGVHQWVTVTLLITELGKWFCSLKCDTAAPANRLLTHMLFVHIRSSPCTAVEYLLTSECIYFYEPSAKQILDIY